MKQFVWMLALVAAALAPSQSVAQVISYDNTATSSGTGFINGGTANQAGNLITRMVMDDINVISGQAGLTVTQINFSVFNSDVAAISARPRLRFWNADGPGGTPGTYLSTPGAQGYTFGAIAFAPGASVFFFTPTAFVLPASTFWAGITFDNNTGATGATLAQMDLLGQAVFGPPAVGTSSDNIFMTTAAGSFFNIANPAGAIQTLAPAGSSLGWQFQTAAVPEPGSMALCGGAIAVVGFLRRRRAAKV